MDEPTLTQADLSGLMALLDDVRCDLIEAQKALVGIRDQSTLPEVMATLVDGKAVLGEMGQVFHAMLQDIVQMLRDQQQPAQVVTPKPTLPRWALWAGLGLVALQLAWNGSRLLWPAETYKAFAASLNTAVEQTYPQLPRAAQDAFSAAYKKHGYQIPGQKGGR